MADAKFERECGVNPPTGPIQPIELKLDSKINFRCHKNISCFNACCKNINITLTPYDILRLKKRLGLSSDEFLVNHAVPFEMDHHGMPGFKMRKQENSTACQFMIEQGCSVYEDRPAACRYYPLGTMGMRRKDEDNVTNFYFKVMEDHCKGHEEDRTITIADYRKEQGVIKYDQYNEAWCDVVIKKRSAGPTIGKPSERSFQLFQMCSFELDHFRRFINNESFKETIELEQDECEKLNQDDELLLQFAMRFLKQVLFGENTIVYKADAASKRQQKRQQRITQRRSQEIDQQRCKDVRYDKDQGQDSDG